MLCHEILYVTVVHMIPVKAGPFKICYLLHSEVSHLCVWFFKCNWNEDAWQN